MAPSKGMYVHDDALYTFLVKLSKNQDKAKSKNTFAKLLKNKRKFLKERKSPPPTQPSNFIPRAGGNFRGGNTNRFKSQYDPVYYDERSGMTFKQHIDLNTPKDKPDPAYRFTWKRHVYIMPQHVRSARSLAVPSSTMITPRLRTSSSVTASSVATTPCACSASNGVCRKIVKLSRIHICGPQNSSSVKSTRKTQRRHTVPRRTPLRATRMTRSKTRLMRMPSTTTLRKAVITVMMTMKMVLMVLRNQRVGNPRTTLT